MKKILLLATCAVALSMNAQDYPKMTQDWKVDITAPHTDVRQGTLLNGTIYINNRADQTILAVKDGTVTTTNLVGGANCAITTDEAGHLVVGTSTFPNAWSAEAPTIKVIDVTGAKADVNLTLPAEITGSFTRVDFLGKAAGDLMGEGTLFIQGNGSTSMGVVKVADGAVNEDETYLATCEGATYGALAITHAYTSGEDVKGLHIARNAAPAFIEFDGDNLKITRTLTLSDKGASNGGDMITVGGQTLYVCPGLGNYFDAFNVYDISDATAESYSPIVAQAATVAANPNGSQTNWLYFEKVSDKSVKVYQYVPGAYAACNTIVLGEETGVNDVNASKAVSSVRYYNIAGVEAAEAFDGVNVMVTTYTDGSKSAVKVIK